MQANTSIAFPDDVLTDNNEDSNGGLAKDAAKEANCLVEQMIANSLHRLAKSHVAPVKVDWPTGFEITPEKGIVAIETCIESWAIERSWKHCTKYLGQEGLRLKYCVQWSIPTRRKPVPRATASVYFFLQPQDDMHTPVLVFYVVEGQRLVHRPEQTVFQEVWLRNTIDNKLATTQGASLLQL